MTNTLSGSGSFSGSGDITAELPTLLGGLLSSDSTYYYRTFTSTDNVTATGGITADVLVIAGGGAGGSYSNAGGGGCGTVTLFSQQSLSKGTYACTIAAPSGNATRIHTLKQGNPSQFGSLSSVVGGGQGYSETQAATRNGGGGSAGGAGSQTGIVPAYPNRTGGDGTNAYSSWLSAITSQMTSVSGWDTATSGGRIAGGGSASKSPNYYSPGGLGGGGEGAPPTYNNNGNGGDAVTNTGSGGGGGGDWYYDTGGSGASGLIILRWLK